MRENKMALIDIDRHVLADLARYYQEIKDLVYAFTGHWFDIIEVRDKTEVLLFTQKESPERQAELHELRNKIFNATVEGTKNSLQIRERFDKCGALLLHLVEEVKEIDTQNGKERGGEHHGPEEKSEGKEEVGPPGG